jgi:DNA-directed RNA polymerase specialized sigma24 family protein
MTFSREVPASKPANDYATAKDFCRLFRENTDELYQLSFLLTADHRKAEQCFVAGLQDSVKENHVFKQWARSWAKRTIIQNAIRELKPRPLPISSPLGLPPCGVPLPSDQGRHFEVDFILAVDHFERFVFVMSVLEHYSEHETSILLGCSPREVREARARAIAQLAKAQGAIFLSRANTETAHELAR